MRKKSILSRRRGRRRAGVFATLAAFGSMLVASIGAAPAQGATQTGWIPLHCGLAGALEVHVGASLTATFPDSVEPGGTFELTGVTTEVIFPPEAQQAGAVFGADAIQGIVTDFQVNLTNATVNFAATPNGPTQSSPTQFNSVRAVQPPNQPASGNPHINGNDTTRGGFQPSTPPEAFSFGDVPTDTTGGSGNAYGPAPGLGGGFAPGSGTPDTLPPIGPITVTGADGENVTLVNQNPGGPDVAGIPAGNPRVATNQVSFHRPNGTYTNPVPADCAFDVSEDALDKPDPNWVDAFVIPIVGDGGGDDGVGSASARGTLPDATLGDVQFSAITDCDEAANTRPFIVRWTEGATTHTFSRTSTETSTCTGGVSGANINEGTGAGTVDGSTPATLTWSFSDGGGPDAVGVTVTPDTGPTVTISGAPDPLSGSPGGVWVRGELPWPPGAGT